MGVTSILPVPYPHEELNFLIKRRVPDAMPSIFLRRVAAFLIDIALLFAILALVGALVQGALGWAPATARHVYLTLLINFSLPVWAYFTLADRSRAGATIGKRWLALRTEDIEGERITTWQALGRTAIKMLPWETAHISAFLLAPELGQFGMATWIGLGVCYALSITYLVVAWRSRGHRSVHDAVAGTYVSRPTP